MGKLWQASDGVDLANLNSPVTFDARVSASASVAIGTTYPTVTAALAAGKRSIYVEGGTYAAGFSVDVPDVLIFCAHPPAGAGGYGSATFATTITITTHYVTIVNAHRLGGVSTAGFRVNHGLAGVRLIDCASYGVPGVGFYLNYTAGTGAASYDCHLVRCFSHECTGGGDGFYWGDSDFNYDWFADGCIAVANSRYGFAIGPSSTVPVNATDKLVTLSNCNGWVNVSSGVTVGPNVSASIIGGRYRGNSGNGIYISTPGHAIARSSVIGARVRSNTLFGIALQAASFGHVIMGNQSYSNGAGHYSLCASSPGTGQTIGIGALATAPNVPAAAYTILSTNNAGA